MRRTRCCGVHASSRPALFVRAGGGNSKGAHRTRSMALWLPTVLAPRATPSFLGDTHVQGHPAAVTWRCRPGRGRRCGAASPGWRRCVVPAYGASALVLEATSSEQVDALRVTDPAPAKKERKGNAKGASSVSSGIRLEGVTKVCCETLCPR